jgi:hypothetical protein
MLYLMISLHVVASDKKDVPKLHFEFLVVKWFFDLRSISNIQYLFLNLMSMCNLKHQILSNQLNIPQNIIKRRLKVINVKMKKQREILSIMYLKKSMVL